MAGADNAFQTFAAGEPAGVCRNPQEANANIPAKNKTTVRTRTIIRRAPVAQRENTLSRRTQQGPRDIRVPGTKSPSSGAVLRRASALARLNRPKDVPPDGARGDRPTRISSEIRKLTTLEVV